MTNTISGSWLKVIAIFSMTIDHIAYYYGVSNPFVYELMRTIGRIAFPTFAFLLAEGYVHTRNRKQYMLSLFTFAILSEVPWFLLNHDGSHNVLFTLLAGVIGMHVIDNSKNRWVTLSFLILIGCATMMAETDYSLNGYVLTLLFFMFRGRPGLQVLFGLPLMYEYGMIGMMMAFAVILLYNGERGFIHGKAAKYAFYAFYPVHLMLIYLIR